MYLQALVESGVKAAVPSKAIVAFEGSELHLCG
jgi:hypothetical protein